MYVCHVHDAITLLPTTLYDTILSGICDGDLNLENIQLMNDFQIVGLIRN